MESCAMLHRFANAEFIMDTKILLMMALIAIVVRLASVTAARAATELTKLA